MVDVLVIGGGPNGLVAAARLAGEGRDVLLLEGRDVLGGLAAGEEFCPGYRHAGVHHDTARLSALVAKELGLAEHGLAREPHKASVLLANEKGPGLLLAGDARLAGEEIARHSERDAERYAAWRATLARIAPILATLQSKAPPDALNPGFHTLLELGRSGFALRRLGKKHMLDLLRISPMCVADWLGEWFETELLKAGLALPAISGTWLGPWSPGSNMNLLLAESGEQAEVRGGGAAVIAALEAAAKARGVTIRTAARVSGIRLTQGAVSGVELEDGETIDGKIVLATCDPKQTLLELVPPRDLSRDAAHHAQVFRARGTTAVVHLALSGPLEFAGREGEPIERARIGATLDDLERAFDGVKYGRMPALPALEVSVPSMASAGLAPPGGAVVSVLVHFVPFDLAGGWTDERREELGALALETLLRHAPSVKQVLVAQETLTPADLAQRYGTTGGHIHHGEHALDQLFLRPTPETARYRAPVPGLFLGGSGSHPGGGLTGLPGWLSAGAVLG